MSPPEEIVRKAIEALGRGDIPGHLADISEDIVFEMKGSTPIRGKSNYEGILEWIYDDDSPAQQIISVRIFGVEAYDKRPTRVSVEDYRIWRFHRSDSNVPQRITSWPERFISKYTVDNGRIMRIKLRARDGVMPFWYGTFGGGRPRN